MSNTSLDTEIKRKNRAVSSMPKMKHSWPLYSGRIPTVEEAAKSVKSLTSAQRKCILINAGIIDEDGNLTEIYI